MTICLFSVDKPLSPPPKISDLVFEELNGVPGQSSFSASPKIAGRISAQLNNPIMFEYVSGHIGDIRASAAVSDTVLNIVRGILGFFQVTLKTTQRVYELEEVRTRCSVSIYPKKKQ